MAYNTPETVADYLARFQMEITHRGKGTFTPDHVKYSLTIASGGKDFFTTFESNPHVHGEPTITQVFGALASDAMVVRDYGMDEFVDEFCDGMKPSAAIRAYNSCKETYDWMRDGLIWRRLRRSRDRLWTGYRRYRRSRKPLRPECGYGTRRERKGIRRGVRRVVEGRAF